MSERKIIKFEQFAPNCKHKMGGCGIRADFTKQASCSFENCPILEQLPDAEPILEAATRYLQDNESGAKNERIIKLKAALKASGVEL
jgi:hypothetical protein